jgi:hypothetical protein
MRGGGGKRFASGLEEKEHLVRMYPDNVRLSF